MQNQTTKEKPLPDRLTKLGFIDMSGWAKQYKIVADELFWHMCPRADWLVRILVKMAGKKGWPDITQTIKAYWKCINSCYALAKFYNKKITDVDAVEFVRLNKAVLLSIKDKEKKYSKNEFTNFKIRNYFNHLIITAADKVVDVAVNNKAGCLLDISMENIIREIAKNKIGKTKFPLFEEGHAAEDINKELADIIRSSCKPDFTPAA